MSAEPIPGRCGKWSRRATPEKPDYCESWPVKGTPVCRMHGGSAKQVKRAAAVRAAKVEAIAEAERMVARAGVEADPLEHLLESLYRAAALVEVWGRMVADIDAQAAREMGENVRGELGYVEVDDEDSHDVLRVEAKDRLMGLNHKGEASVHPYVIEYNQALDRRAKFAKMCLDAGVAERQIKLAEEQAQMIASVINGILSDLGVKRTATVNEVIAKQLRELTPNFG